MKKKNNFFLLFLSIEGKTKTCNNEKKVKSVDTKKRGKGNLFFLFYSFFFFARGESTSELTAIISFFFFVFCSLLCTPCVSANLNVLRVILKKNLLFTNNKNKPQKLLSFFLFGVLLLVRTRWKGKNPKKNIKKWETSKKKERKITTFFFSLFFLKIHTHTHTHSQFWIVWQLNEIRWQQ